MEYLSGRRYSRVYLILWLISNSVFLVENAKVFIGYGPHGKADAIKALNAIGVKASALISVYDNIAGFSAKLTPALAERMKSKYITLRLEKTTLLC